uniref:transcription termination factor Rho n=1 Tax=Candidatus Collinsella stercoripullorum TaxID=2838522 RepID=UPI0022E3E940
EGGSREGRRRHDRASRNQERNGGRQRADRAERNRNGKRGNRYNVPNEPTLTREELAARKVAELREKARELDLDVTGKKKAELVEEIYTAAARAEGFRDIEGILEIANEGFGYIRAHGYMPTRDDAFVPANLIRAARLRSGDLISGTLRPSRANDKYPGLAKIHTVNGLDPEQIRHRPKFSELTPIYPNEPLKMEHGRESITGRAIDIVSPIGKGQRGLIVSPPKAGKTTVLKHICQSIAINNPEVHLICLLVDERPEEVTDMERSIKGDVVASTFDMPADNHTRVSELVIERAKRIVEMGGDVVVVLDSITRLARAYNLAAPASGRILSGGVDSAALYPPKRFLGAARNIENGGSLTILASALVDTGSKMDEVIFEEFKGTGNMELKLDRDLADRRIFPAIDPVASGTRNEDLLVDENMRPFVWGIRRILANMSNTERAAASFIKGLKGTNSNEEFLIRTAKKAADHPEAL